MAVRDGVPVEFATETRDYVPGTFTDKDGRLNAVITRENVEDIKGLEFDHVVVVDPDDIVAASPQGLQNLYVAVTRATQSLTLAGRWQEIFH